MDPSEESQRNSTAKAFQLTPDQIKQINDALSSVSEYGEVHLVIQHGMLKYINVLNSHKAWRNGNEAGDED